MSAETALRPFDFQEVRRLAPVTSRALVQWQTETCTLLSEAWSSLSTYPVKVTPGRAEPQRSAAAMAATPDPATGIVLMLGPQKVPTLMTLDPVLLQAIFADLLGSAEAEKEPEAELTTLEEALLDMLLGSLRESISDSWPGETPLLCTVKEICRPRRSRRLTGHEEVIRIAWRIECRFHSGDLHWLVPRRELEALLEGIQSLIAVYEVDGPAGLGPLVEQFPLDIAVELGHATISTSAMTRLQVGDVLVLDQPLERPLVARVTGEPMWRVEPCRVGQRQAVEIHSLLED